MKSGESAQDSGDRGSTEFTQTRWSVVLLAGQPSAPESFVALERLCRTYWSPVYAFVRRQGHAPEDAQDLTQEFFARLLKRNFFALADPDKGRFRSFLLSALKFSWPTSGTGRAPRSGVEGR